MLSISDVSITAECNKFMFIKSSIGAVANNIYNTKSGLMKKAKIEFIKR